MTNEDWKYINENWGKLFQVIDLKVDGYDVSLQFHQLKMKIVPCVYVNGWLKGEHGNVLNNDKEENPNIGLKEPEWNEVGRRFWQTKTKRLWTNKYIREYERFYGKRQAKKRRMYDKIFYKTPYWSSFSAFKKHLEKNNKSIELKRR